MNNELKILTIKEKTKIFEKLRDQFGITELKGLLVKRGAERIFLFQGNFNPEEIKRLERTVPIERVGIYFAKFLNEDIRLSIDGVILLKDQITKNIFELTDEQTELWMKGNELNVVSKEKGVLAMKHNNDFLGCGKASAEKITNFIPKTRRLKEKS